MKNNINKKNIKILTIILISFLLLTLFIVSIKLLNLHFKNISNGDERNKTRVSDGRNKIERNILNRGSETTARNNEERVEQEYSNTDAIKFEKTDIANFTNIIARLNGFYILGKPEINKRDPNLVFKGEVIKLPSGEKLIAKQQDSLWNFAIEALKINFKENFKKIYEFKKKIRKIQKRILDIVQEVSIIKKEIKAAIESAYIIKQKLILKELLKEVNDLPKR